MRAVAIKLKDGRYYAGCNKQPAKTLLGAQLYKSEAAAMNTVNKSINFHEPANSIQIVPIILSEMPNIPQNKLEEALHDVGHAQSKYYYLNEVLNTVNESLSTLHKILFD